MINVPLLKQTLDYITAHRNEWDQKNWGKRTECGTTFCLAGHALQLSGARMRWIPRTHDPAESILVSANGKYPEDAAREIFGLTWDDAGKLFHYHNTLQDLWYESHNLTNGEIEIPEEFK